MTWHVWRAVPTPVRRPVAVRQADESGLTTLEWLLIVAAVAGLAALAVVLVQRAVEDTSEAIAAEHPRVKAAGLEAASITEEARGELSTVAAANDAAAVGSVNDTHNARCGQLAIIYRGLDLDFTWHDAVAGNARPTGDAGEAACEVTKSA